MSYLTHIETPCTYCKHPNDAEVWSSVNVQTDPELKDILLGGELNMIECVSCKEIFYAEHFLLYHDPAFELMAFVYPQSYESDKTQWTQKTKEDYALSQANLSASEKLAYPPLTLFGLDQLLFVVEEEEETAIQAEIVLLLASDHGFEARKLKPSLAREKNLPFVLPYIKGANHSARESVLAALEKIRIANDRLIVYTKLESQIRENPSMEIPAELVAS